MLVLPPTDERPMRLLHRPEPDLESLLELQRLLDGHLPPLEEVSPAEFDRELQKRYENNSSETMQAMQGLDDDMPTCPAPPRPWPSRRTCWSRTTTRRSSA